MMLKKLMLIIVAILFVLSTTYAVDESLLLGKIISEKGEVQLKRGDNEWTALKKGEAIYVGDKIQTSSQSRATMKYQDGTILKLKPTTMVEFKVNGLRIFLGKTWFKVIKRNNQFEIQTPSMIAGIRGTIFDVDVKLDKTSFLRVFKGLVEVAAQGKSVLVGKGTYTMVKAGQKPIEPQKFDVKAARKEWFTAFNPFMNLKKKSKKVGTPQILITRVGDIDVEKEKKCDTEVKVKPQSYLDAYQRFLELKVKYNHDMNNPEVRKAFLRYKKLYNQAMRNSTFK